MRVAVLQSNYIPWKGYFDLIRSADIFVFYDEVQYTKNDWRNRNKIYTKSGLQWLTIPISANAVKMKISEVEIEDSGWREKHLRALETGYGSAPFFFQLRSLMDEIYLSSDARMLSIFNQRVIVLISRWLGLKTQFLNSKDFQLVPGRVERLLHLLQQVGATEYLSGPSAKDYLSPSLTEFDRFGIQLRFADYSSYPSYPQLSSPFESAVSVLDAIANLSREEIGDFIFSKNIFGDLKS